MRFTAKLDFKHGRHELKAGKFYISKELGLTDKDVEGFYAAGWVDIEGRPPCPEPQTTTHLAVRDCLHV